MDRTRISIAVLLLLVTLTVYWQAGNNDFINYDDNIYVTDNPQVMGGLSWQGLRWAFTSFHAANWHPLTWLSHMTDIELYGLQPRGHHLTSVLFHGANVVLLFLLLVRATGGVWPSAFAAAIVALHPHRVESVAWVAERKDVLAVMFGLLALHAYIRYVERPALFRYLLLVIMFVMSLLCKPMLVTLPFVLLLLDYWPLNRFGDDDRPDQQMPATSPARLVGEKVPLFVLSAASSIITVYAQQHGHTVATMTAYPLQLRIENAVVAYVQYLGSLIFPTGLAVFYPLPTASHPATTIAAALLIIALTVLVVSARRRQPFLMTGWLWYLGTLVPVIGLVQVGAQSRADRYTYFPMIGLVLIVAWAGKRFAEVRPGRQRILGALAVVTLVLLSVQTRRYIAHWRDSQALFRHAIAVTENNYVALSFLGNDLLSRGYYREAGHYYALSLSIMPQQAETHHNLALSFIQQGNYHKAERHLLDAISLMPGMVEPHYELALLLARQGRSNEAVRHFNEVLRLVPGHSGALVNRERCLHTPAAVGSRPSGS